jgi:hypothetical protein
LLNKKIPGYPADFKRTFRAGRFFCLLEDEDVQAMVAL